MTRQHLLAVFSFFILSAFSVQAAAGKPEEEIIEIKNAFIPVGFDNNDEVQIAVAGVLTDSCYRIGPTRYTIDEQNGTIGLKQIIYDHTNSSKLCMKIEMPFNHVVDLGVLSKSRNYTVTGITKTTEKKLGVLSIADAPHPNKKDENLYAPVTEAFLKQADGKFTLVMKGLYSPSCMELKKTEKITYPENQVLVVLPTWKIKEGNEKNCTVTEADLQPFIIEEPIDSIVMGTYMIHIRTYQWKAINLFQNFTKKKSPR